MPTRQKAPLRPLSEQEYQELLRIIRASSERLDRVRRAKAVLAVAGGHSFTGAAYQSGFKSGESIAQLVERFNQHGLCALDIARGRGPKPTYDSPMTVRYVPASYRRYKPHQTAVRTALPPGHCPHWNVRCARKGERWLLWEPPPYEAYCMRRATPSSAPAPGVLQALPFAFAAAKKG